MITTYLIDQDLVRLALIQARTEAADLEKRISGCGLVAGLLEAPILRVELDCRYEAIETLESALVALDRGDEMRAVSQIFWEMRHLHGIYETGRRSSFSSAGIQEWLDDQANLVRNLGDVFINQLV